MNIQMVKGQPSQYISNPTVRQNNGANSKEFKLDLAEVKKVDDGKETLEQMIEDINDIQNKMDFDMTVENVMEYKDIVKSFLKYYTENCMETNDINYWNGKNNQKLTIVKKINDNLDEIDDAMSLLETKSGHLDMLNKIGEINGMLVRLRV